MSDALEISMLARLIEKGDVRWTKLKDALICRYETARWIDKGKRNHELIVRESMLPDLETRLETLMPSWRQDFEYLRSIGRNPHDPRDIDLLPALRRQAEATTMINRRTWNAATGLGPKHQASLPAQAVLTKDWVIRFRPNIGLRGVFAGRESSICDPDSSSAMEECLIPERKWMKFEVFSGVLPKIMITCENLGAYIDLPVNESMMVIYSPGMDIEAASCLVKSLPGVPWVHFGDLDPEGLMIAENIARAANRETRMFIPAFAIDYMPGSPLNTGWGNEVPDLPVFTDLKRAKRRIYQEVFLLDERLSGELALFADGKL